MISKALFLLGGPGSGKDYVINNILSRFNVVEVQMDQILNGSVNHLIESKVNLLINAPVDMDKIALVRATLGEAYDFDYTLVSVTNKISRERNEMRTRPMNESVRIRKWLDAERTTDVFENVFKFENSLNLSEATQKELTIFQMQIEAFLKFMIENGYEMSEAKMPDKYKTGNPETDKARFSHWRKMGKLSDRNPKAYQDAPGDKKAREEGIPLSPHTVAVRKMMKNEACWSGYTQKGMKKKGNKMVPNCVPVKEGFDPEPKEIAAYLKKKHGTVKPEHLDAYERSRDTSKPLDREEIMKHLKESDKSLAAKAQKSGISVGTLKKVYRRGVAAWNSGHRPGTTPQQWGHARVNSYINKGKTYHTADKDLREALEDGTKETLNAYLKATPGQEIDVTPTLKRKPAKKGGIVPPSDLNARQGGGGGYIGGLTQTFPESVSLKEAVQYHLENKIPFAENIFRPGSDMFFELIREAKNLYTNGEYTPADEYEQEVLESDLGEIGIYEGQEVMLDFPFIEEEKTAKHVRKLSKVEADEEEAVKTSIQKEANDYFLRRKREEDIISGKKPPRKKIPTKNDYAERRAKMAEEACCDDCDDLNEEEGSSDPTKGKGIGKPWKEGGGGAVYVRSGDGVKKVRFSQSGMAKRYRDPARLKSFMARHNCLGNTDKTSASYWACRYPRFFSNTGQLWW